MAQGYDTEEQKERVLLVGVQLDNQEDMESSLEELKALAKTAGAETVGKVIQPRDAYHPATYIGKEIRGSPQSYRRNRGNGHYL